MSCYNIKINSKNIKLCEYNESYFIKDQYQKDTYFDYEDAYYYYDIGVDKILLFKKSDDEYFIRYEDLDKTNIFHEIWAYNNGDKIMYIENSDKEFLKKNREIWNKIIELIDINNAPDFVQTTLHDDSEFIEADVLENTSFVKSCCYKDKFIIVFHSVVNNYLKASLIQAIQ